MLTGLGGRSDVRATGFAREQQVRRLQPGIRGGQSFGGENRNFLLNDDICQITDTSRDVVGCGHHDSNKYSSSITQLRHYMKDLEQEIGRVEKEFRRTRTNYNVRQGSDAAAAIDIRHSNVECSI